MIKFDDVFAKIEPKLAPGAADDLRRRFGTPTAQGHAIGELLKFLTGPQADRYLAPGQTIRSEDQSLISAVVDAFPVTEAAAKQLPIDLHFTHGRTTDIARLAQDIVERLDRPDMDKMLVRPPNRTPAGTDEIREILDRFGDRTDLMKRQEFAELLAKELAGTPNKEQAVASRLSWPVYRLFMKDGISAPYGTRPDPAPKSSNPSKPLYGGSAF